MLNAVPLNKFVAKMENGGKVITEKMTKSLKTNSEIIWDDAKRYAPVDTGNLRDNIRVEEKGLMSMIGVDTALVPYAQYVHTHNPFLDRALDENMGKILKNIDDDFYDAVYETVKEAKRG